MQITFRSFIKNGKERKERRVLLKRMDAQPWYSWSPAWWGLTLKKRKILHKYNIPYFLVYLFSYREVKNVFIVLK